ncbi:protein NLRC3-like [Archocentrus centrarchus]|uniref:protein NLRC3-like n=1 Tax=Archocentrus centrarchus TaxID=63155 RepID=UPI0011E9EDD0|nr:protein NLRC3-like [Archocentrus centrarchus]
MDSDTEVEGILQKGDEMEDEEKHRWQRPPSSYGSMKSESDDMEDTDKEEEKKAVSVAPQLPEPRAPEKTGIQMIRSASPETLYTMTTQQTKPPGAVIIDTRSCDLDLPDDEYSDEEGEEDEILITNSPEPPQPIEPDDPMPDENSQPGRLHPEQDLPHIFRNIQDTLSRLSWEEMMKFKSWFYQWEPELKLKQMLDGDILDFVDKLLEVLGQDRALTHTITSLENINKKPEAEQLSEKCKRALMRFRLQLSLIRKHQVIREGVIQAGKQNFLDKVFVEPEISTCGYGGIYPTHNLRPPPSPVPVPSPDTFVRLNNLIRLTKADSTPVRTVLTTGLAGIGMSVCVGKFCLDWAEQRANKDLQFVIKLSFRALWILRNKHLPESQEMSIMEIIEYYNSDCSEIKTFLEEENCKFLVIMDSFDRYQAALDWENAPVIDNNHTPAHPDVLIVNIIRGTVLRGARLWILGRRAAVSQIPSKFIDVVTEIQGFNDEMKERYLTNRWQSNTDMATKVVSHFKRLPMLVMAARNPFVCWMVATVFERCYRYRDYGSNPPRLTPFYVNILMVQMNRRLQFYYERRENDLKWSTEDKNLVTKLGKMALKMLEKDVSVFYVDDVKEHGLNLTEVAVLCGMCTELPTPAADGRMVYSFIHFTFQEFMAALYVFTMFRAEEKNILDSGTLYMPKIFTSKEQTKSIAGLIQCALARTFNAPRSQYDIFLRFLCGLLSPDCHDNQLCGYLFRQNSPKVGGLDQAQRLLEQTIEKAPPNKVENLKECLREMIQKDE